MSSEVLKGNKTPRAIDIMVYKKAVVWLDMETMLFRATLPTGHYIASETMRELAARLDALQAQVGAEE